MSETGSTTHARQRDAPTGGSVVLMRERDPGCEVLLCALSARGLSPVAVHDEPGAMLELANFADRSVQRRVLIVVEPAHWPRLDQLMDAVRAYHGSVYCWQFDSRDGATPMLSEWSGGSSHRAGQAERADQSGGGPIGKIRKRSRPVDQILVTPNGHEQAPREVVTQQELTMLLGPAPGEAG